MQERRTDAAPGWAESAGLSSGLLYLTPQELAEVLTTWQKMIMALADRLPVGHVAQRPADSVPVSLTLIAVPIDRTEQGG